MHAHYEVLHLIFEIVKNDMAPLSYPCKPRELILRSMLDWSVIQQYLNELEAEGLITTRQLDTLVISITDKGMLEATAAKRSEFLEGTL